MVVNDFDYEMFGQTSQGGGNIVVQNQLKPTNTIYRKNWTLNDFRYLFFQISQI